MYTAKSSCTQCMGLLDPSPLRTRQYCQNSPCCLQSVAAFWQLCGQKRRLKSGGLEVWCLAVWWDQSVLHISFKFSPSCVSLTLSEPSKLDKYAISLNLVRLQLKGSPNSRPCMISLMQKDETANWAKLVSLCLKSNQRQCSPRIVLIPSTL